MIVKVLLEYLLQIGSTIGVIFIFGFLIALCNRQFYSNVGERGRFICYATGFIGTPIHELSHALFCLIFAHKINEIKLFQINSDDGTLGYVNHSYNKKNIYQCIGNFFIGIAPIIVISSLLYLLAYLLLPDFVAYTNSSFKTVDLVNNFVGVFSVIWGVIKAFFSCVLSWQWWVFVLAGLFLGLHMNLSGADIKGALSGLIFVLLAFLIADVILALISVNVLSGFTQGVLSVASYLLCVLILALIISLLALLFSFIIRAISRR